MSLSSSRRFSALALSLAILWAWEAPAFGVDGYEETVPGTPSAEFGCALDDAGYISRDIGSACFFPENDNFWVVDSKEDGQSIGIQWKLTDGSRSGLIRDKLGYKVNSVLNKNFLEGKTLKWRMGKCNVTSTNNCHQASGYTSWGTGINATAFCISTSLPEDGYACSWP